MGNGLTSSKKVCVQNVKYFSAINISKRNTIIWSLCFMPIFQIQQWYRTILSTQLIKGRITCSTRWTVGASLAHLVHGPSTHVATLSIVTVDDSLVPAVVILYDQHGYIHFNNLPDSPYSWPGHTLPGRFQPRLPGCSDQLILHTWGKDICNCKPSLLDVYCNINLTWMDQ